MLEPLPTQAQVVVIGGGVVGTSVAYHLAKLGHRDVLLLERSKIGSGTSWHAAGNMETYRADPLIGEMIAYAVDLYPKLEQETGQALGWRQSGRVMFTTDPVRMASFRGLPALGRVRGIEIELLSPEGVEARLPIIDKKGLAGGLWIPSDGRINPTDLAMAFARGARQRGARVLEDAPVTSLKQVKGRVQSVMTEQGEMKCETVVIAAGLWSHDIGRAAGVAVPLHAVHHFYILTKPIPGVSRDLPLFLSYDERLYGREDVGGLLVGFFDANAVPVTPADLPKDFSFSLLPSNWDQVEANMAIALERFPVLKDAEVKMLLNGPESFTPDMQMLLGESPTLKGCFLATGMNSSGIALSAAAGRLTAEWIVHGQPSMDVTKLDVCRFAKEQNGVAYRRERASEVIVHMCRSTAADRDFERARNVRRSPLQSALERAGAKFKSVAAWERPIWFAPDGEKTKPWYARVADEVAAAETAVVLIDLSSDSKLWLEGPRAATLLRSLSGAIGDLAVGATVRAPMFNERGGVEALPLVTQMQGTAYLICSEPEHGVRTKAWIDRARRADDATLVDVTSGWAVIGLAGPAAEHLIGQASHGDPADVYSTEINYSPVLIQRAGVPGMIRLVTPTEQAPGVYERLIEVGADLGLRHAGSLAARALTIKHHVVGFGSEASPFLSAVGSGLHRLVDLDRAGSFVGRDALHSDIEHGPRREIRAFSAAVAAPGLFENAPVLAEGRVVGHITGSAFIPSIGNSVVMALIERQVPSAQLTVLIDGETMALEPR